jgi:hypothetical protein
MMANLKWFALEMSSKLNTQDKTSNISPPVQESSQDTVH